MTIRGSKCYVIMTNRGGRNWFNLDGTGEKDINMLIAENMFWHWNIWICRNLPCWMLVWFLSRHLDYFFIVRNCSFIILRKPILISNKLVNMYILHLKSSSTLLLLLLLIRFSTLIIICPLDPANGYWCKIACLSITYLQVV